MFSRFPLVIAAFGPFVDKKNITTFNLEQKMYNRGHCVGCVAHLLDEL